MHNVPLLLINLEAGGPITQNRVGRWHRELPQKVLRDLESELKVLMLATGYTIDDK